MYDMDELEIQNKILLDITSRELKEEKDKWHRKYNDAEIEISHLKREVDSLISAVKTLIKERDMAIRDINLVLTHDIDCHICVYDSCCDFEDFEKTCGKWRGVKR